MKQRDKLILARRIARSIRERPEEWSFERCSSAWMEGGGISLYIAQGASGLDVSVAGQQIMGGIVILGGLVPWRRVLWSAIMPWREEARSRLAHRAFSELETQTKEA